MMRPLISLAAVADRCASSRTSCATTAKPLPASPARAASTPAFSARRLVWKAISSITPMIREISAEDCAMPSMEFTACCTTSPDLPASSQAWLTAPAACAAFSALELTCAVNSLRAAAVSSRLAACCSVRCERSLAARVISPVPLPMLTTVALTVETVSSRLASAELKSSRSFAYSPGNSSSMR
ncbi:hypothetical protein D3C78_1142210 [compost metagenome]